MSDAPERIWVWRNQPHGEWVISTPNEPYPTGSPEYVPAAALAEANARIKALEAALRRIARQKTTNEMEPLDVRHGDFEGAYDTMIDAARAALDGGKDAKTCK